MSYLQLGLTATEEAPTIDALRDHDGFINEELRLAVEREIKQYPNTDAPQWLGGVAAIRTVERWLYEHGRLTDRNGNASIPPRLTEDTP